MRETNLKCGSVDKHFRENDNKELAEEIICLKAKNILVKPQYKAVNC